MFPPLRLLRTWLHAWPLARLLTRHLRLLALHASTRLGFFSALALAALSPLLGRAGSFNEFRDAQFLYAYEDVAVETVRRFGQIPLWNPYYCGGMYALGAPQERFASPPFLLSLIFGAGRAQVVIAFCMLVLGMEGFYRYLRERTASSLGPALAAPLLGLNGLYATSFFNGWILVYGFALLPWILLGVLRTLRRDPWGLVLVAVGSAWMIGFGIHYAPLFGVLYGALEVGWVLVTRWREGRRLFSRVAWLGLAGLFALGLSAFRLWPVVETLAQMPRVMAGAPGNSWSEIAHALFFQATPRFGNLDLRGEFFFGLWPLPLVILGLGRRRLWPAAVLIFLSLWAATGYAYSPGPFAWLRELPGFAVARYPERFLWFACWYSSLLVAGGFDLLVLLGRKRPWTRFAIPLAATLLATGYVGLVRNHHAALRGMVLGAPPAELGQPFAQARGNRWLAGYYAPLGRGSLSCMEGYPAVQSERLRGDLKREEYLSDPTAGEVERTSWSPNRIELEVKVSRAALLLVNQNWHAGWHANIGSVRTEEGLLAVELPPGDHAVTLRFLPRSALGGTAISLAALIGLVVVGRRARRRGGLFGRAQVGCTIGCALVPFVLGAVVRLTVPEPPAPAPLLVNANRAPLVTHTLPAEAHALSVEFEVPVRLEGAVLPKTVDGSGIAHFELYWRVRGRVPRSAGVFFHLEGPAGQRLQADHEVVGASVFLQNAPRDQLLRDAFSVDFSGMPRGRWTAHAGLWYASGDGRRIGVQSAEPGSAADGRVLVGTFDL